jgi:hypothetical protein
MEERRIIGLDLGIASAHTARVLGGDGTVVAKRKAFPTIESLSALEAAALEGAPPGTVLEVVIEPTGPAWLPIAVFFISRATRSSGFPRPRRTTCAGTCRATPSRTASMPMRWPR